MESNDEQEGNDIASYGRHEIVDAREKAVAKLEGMGYEVVNTLFTDEWYSDAAMERRGAVVVEEGGFDVREL